MALISSFSTTITYSLWATFHPHWTIIHSWGWDRNYFWLFQIFQIHLCMFHLCYRAGDDRKGHLKSTQCYIIFSSNAISEVGMQSCFFSYTNTDKRKALESSIKQQKFLHLPLYYTGALPYYITFCFENTGQTVTRLKQSGEKKRWHAILTIEYESKKTFEHLLFICPGTCVSMRDFKKSENLQMSLERQWTKATKAFVKPWPQIKKPSGQWLQLKVARMLQRWGLTDLQSEIAKRLTGCWNTNK